MTITIADIEAAALALKGAITATPLLHSQTLSALTGAEIWLKFENRQFTGSFKDRGALNMLRTLGPEVKKSGVIAMSAGNHAQGVAYHATRLGIPSTIVMPRGTPFVKVTGTEVLGATVVLEGETVDEAADYAHKLAAQKGLTFVHPYDDPLVIAGQGTIGLELAASGVALDAVVVPIAGGGLIAGLATALKARAPKIAIYGVQSLANPSMWNAIHQGSRAIGAQSVADGIAVKTPGTLTQPIVKALVEDVLLVDEGAIEQAILTLLDIEKTVVEGAGATPLAALTTMPKRFAGKRVGLIVSGGNIDPRLMASIIMRGLARVGRLARLRIQIPDRPGMLGRVAQVIGAAHANILEVYHERAFSQLSAKSAGLVVVLETRDETHIAQVTANLQAGGFAVERLLPNHPGANEDPSG
ncbi:MAG: threonine ammonia-lyase [Alphaproteobacteria bacterium]|nr:threonine ammonia-lyase [Alphaproteobacteria bacterium]